MSLEEALAANTAVLTRVADFLAVQSRIGQEMLDFARAQAAAPVTPTVVDTTAMVDSMVAPAEAPKPEKPKAAAKTTPAPKEVPASAEPTATVAPAAAAPAEKADSASSTTPAADAPSASVTYDVITYEMVRDAINAAVKTQRDHVVATLAKFGVKKGTELVHAQYADFLKALKS